MEEHEVWKERLFEAVAGLGEEGRASVEFLKRRQVKIGFKNVRPNIGAFWTIFGNIRLNSHYYSYATPFDDLRLKTLIIHEARHLQQGVFKALSVYGELDAWQLEFGIYQRVRGRYPRAAIADIGAPMGVPATTSGTFYIDEILFRDDGEYIGPNIYTPAQNATQAQTADNVALSAHYTVTVQNATQAQIATEIYKDRVLATSPLAYWTLNESSGSTAINYGSLGTDANGVYTEINQLAVANAPNGDKAPYFDGTTDEVNINTSTLYTAFNPAEMTILAWAKVEDASVWSENEYKAIWKIAKSPSTHYFQLVRIGPTAGMMNLETVVNSSPLSEPKTGLTTTDWMLWSLTRSETDDIQRYYYNGSQLGNGDVDTKTWGTLQDMSNMCWIGCQENRGYSWRGYISNVALWNKVLTPTEISSL